MECDSQALDGVEVERRAQRDVDLVGAGVDVLADAVQHLFVGAREDAGPHGVGERAELRPQALVRPREADVDRSLDVARVAPDDDSQCWSSTPHLWAKASGAMNGTFHPSAYWAAMRRGALLPTATDPDRHCSLHRPWLVAGLGEGEVLPGERGDVVVEKTAEALDALLQLVHAVLHAGERNAR